MNVAGGTGVIVALVLASSPSQDPQTKATPFTIGSRRRWDVRSPIRRRSRPLAVRCVYTKGEIAGEAIRHEDDLFASDMYRSTSDNVSAGITQGGDSGRV